MKRTIAAISLLILLFAGCSEKKGSSEEVRVLVTTGMIGDAVKFLLANNAQVDILMGPGVDPHLYKASQGDMRRISDAKLLVINGLHLEGKMSETFEHVSKTKPVIAVGAGIAESKLIPIVGSNNLHDPHIWLAVDLWSEGIRSVGLALKKSFPDDSAGIGKRLTIYLDSLKGLDAWCRSTLSTIPEAQRILITSHDAFHYFGRAYGIQVKGLQGISTVSEYGLKDISDMVNYICSKNIRSVFIESSVPAQSIQAVMEGCLARKHNLTKGGTLYSDAVGADGSYFSMIKHNILTIQKALSTP